MRLHGPLPAGDCMERWNNDNQGNEPMSMVLLFFYGTIITAIMTTGVVAYVKSQYDESKRTKINHSNFGSD